MLGSKRSPKARYLMPLVKPRAFLSFCILIIFVLTPLNMFTSQAYADISAESLISTPKSLSSTNQPILGERLEFQGRWIGIPVGFGSLEVKEIVTINGRKAYHIKAEGHTNKVLSKFYPIHDIVHSYLDVETLMPLVFEKDQKEGSYRAKERVTFDHERSVAVYESLLNGSRKEITLPNHFHDLVSAIYWFRSLELIPGSIITASLYSDEKIYETDIHIGNVSDLEILKRGTYSCIKVEPKASFKGLLIKRGRIWAYMSTDQRRLPLLIKMTTPWGPMTAVLDKKSLKRQASNIKD